MMFAMLRRGLLFSLLWWVLTGGQDGSLGMGVIAVGLALWASLRLLPPARPISLMALVGFLGYFILNSVRGGLQVARLALRWQRSLQPGSVTLTLTLPPGAARIFLVNALCLMPGSLSVRLEGDCLHVHVLDTSLPVEAETRALEARIARVFGRSA